MANSLFETPKFEPKIRAGKVQSFGILFLFLIPILALFGVFGKGATAHHHHEDGLEVLIEYPERARAGRAEVIRVQIINTSESKFENIQVHFEPKSMERLIEARFRPEANADLIIDLESLRPGEEKSG